LALLVERPMHGYEIIQEIGSRTAGVWCPSPGSVYPTLHRLEQEELIAGELVDGRRRFSLTESGEENAEAGHSLPWREIIENVDPIVFLLRDELIQIAAAALHVVNLDTPSQAAKVLEILDQVRRRLYMILADDR
jgi:DNA-binding PadR family transcriptional regulator